MAGESLLVEIHQPALPDGSKGLFLHDHIRLSLVEGIGSQSHCAGGHYQNLAPRLPGGRQIFNQGGNTIECERAFAVEEKIRSKFDNNAGSVSNAVAHQFIIARIRRSSLRCSSTCGRSLESGADLT